jgi:hypothetical protein
LVRARFNTEDSRDLPVEEEITVSEAALEKALQLRPMTGLFEELNGIGDPSFLEVGSPELNVVRRITPVTVQDVSLFQATRQSLSRHRVFLTRIIR